MIAGIVPRFGLNPHRHRIAVGQHLYPLFGEADYRTDFAIKKTFLNRDVVAQKHHPGSLFQSQNLFRRKTEGGKIALNQSAVSA